MSRVYVAGVGLTQVGDRWESSLSDLAAEVGFKAIEAAGILPEGVVVGNMFSAHSSSQEHLGALVANALGLEGVPALKAEGACASGGVAVSVGYTMVKAGQLSSVLVVGVEKMRDLEPRGASLALAMAESAEYTQFVGATFVSLNALLARLYMEECGVSREDLAAFPVLAHQNALTAPHAQLKRPITVEEVAKAPMISDPLTLLDCSPIGDGAAAALLVGEERVAEARSPVVELAASTIATNRFSIYERDDMLEFTATRRATEKALETAGVGLKDIGLVEVHDAFSVVCALSLEAMGFSKRGMAPKEAAEGRFDRQEGEVPILAFGGLKARGHPTGATGVYQVAECYLQLTGRAGENQVEGVDTAMAHSVGGIDTTAVVHILRRCY